MHRLYFRRRTRTMRKRAWTSHQPLTMSHGGAKKPSEGDEGLRQMTLRALTFVSKSPNVEGGRLASRDIRISSCFHDCPIILDILDKFPSFLYFPPHWGFPQGPQSHHIDWTVTKFDLWKPTLCPRIEVGTHASMLSCWSRFRLTANKLWQTDTGSSMESIFVWVFIQNISEQKVVQDESEIEDNKWAPCVLLNSPWIHDCWVHVQTALSEWICMWFPSLVRSSKSLKRLFAKETKSDEYSLPPFRKTKYNRGSIPGFRTSP